VLKEYSWPGNVRQLKNVAEQATVLASERVISGAEMLRFIPDIQDSKTSGLAVVDGSNSSSGFNSDRDLLYKVLFDMRRDVTDLKQLVLSMLSNGGSISPDNIQILERLYPNSHNSHDVVRDHQPASIPPDSIDYDQHPNSQHLQQVRIRRQMVDAESIKTVADGATDAPIIEEKSLSISDNEKELIRKALERNKGSRRKAAKELQISERTLYRKIKDYELDE
jgi:DNA-binding NtrC family response regulator